MRQIGEEHRSDFAAFDVQFDHYDSTNSPENRHYAELIFQRLKEGGHIEKRPARADLLREGQALPARPLCAGHLPQLQGARPVRRRLREVRHDLCADRLDRAALRHLQAPRRCAATPTTTSSSSAPSPTS